MKRIQLQLRDFHNEKVMAPLQLQEISITKKLWPH